MPAQFVMLMIFLRIAFADFLPFLGALVLLSPVILMIFLFWRGYQVDLQRRKKLPSLCSWEYPATEWLEYAARYDLGKEPRGSAGVRITIRDIWIKDLTRTRRILLDDNRKCVTECEYSSGLLQFRVSSWAKADLASDTTFTTLDLTVPVPPANEADAVKTANAFKAYMEEHRKKIDGVLAGDLWASR